MTAECKQTDNDFFLGSVTEPSDIGVSIVSLQMAGDGTVRLSRPASVTEPFESLPLCADHNVKGLGVGTRDQLSAHTKLKPGQHLLHLDANACHQKKFHFRIIE